MEQFCYKLGVILGNIAAMSKEYHSEVRVLQVCPVCVSACSLVHAYLISLLSMSIIHSEFFCRDF